MKWLDKILPVGTRSVLFGGHCFAWHWLPVLIAWKKLFGTWPAAWEFVCIVVHDWAYWGKPNLDGIEGETHPEGGAKLARAIVNFFSPAHAEDAYWLALLHSRHYAARIGKQPSRLCWCDKKAIAYDPWIFYLLRTHLSGEIHEFVDRGPTWLKGNSVAWLHWYRARVEQVVSKREEVASRYV